MLWSHNTQPNTTSSSPYPSRAHFVAPAAPFTTEWLLDSDASHHMMSNVQNLSLHFEYPSTDNIMIGDGIGLPITHTGSTTLPSSF